MNAPGDPPTPTEIAVDGLLDRLLRGEAIDVEAFLGAHPELPPGEVARVRKMARVLGGGRSASTSALPFERLGAYRLLERLGAGGMGIVYLAEDERLGRRVALKLVRPELAGSVETAARFEREARAVARLQHEHIVTVFEAGRIGDVSYLAMERVEGRSLDELLAEARTEQRRVPVRDLLRWMRDVARALAAAHAVDIVHRDVKPSNVRITPAGKALLLDFGLARAADSATLSRTGQIQGTIYYVSPEQVSGGETRVDARTDVWSLGVTLYEGLTGRRPFEGEGSEEVLYQIVSREPVAPRELVPGLPRDVETVVLKALEKERERRYASATELADDLEAVLDGRPIRARPTGSITRAIQWSRRKPAHATSLVLAVLLVAGGPLAFAAVQARHARALKAERDVAEERAKDLEQMALFQGDAIGQIEPDVMAAHLVETLKDALRAAGEAAGLDAGEIAARAERLDELLQGANTTNVAVASLRRDLLEPAIATARERFADRPKVQGMLLHTIASTCWSLGLVDLCLETQRSAQAVLAAHFPATDRDRLSAEANLGYYLLDSGNATEAEPMMRAAARGLAEVHGPDDPSAITARQNVAMLLLTLGRTDECEAEFRAILAARRRVLGDDDPETLASLSTLGAFLLRNGSPDEAATLLKEAYERRRTVLGPGDAGTLGSANNLAVLYRDEERYEDAERVFREAYGAARTSLGDRHPLTSHLCVGLADVLVLQEKVQEAEGLLADSARISSEVSGPFHAETLYDLAKLADARRKLGREDEAQRMLEETYAAAAEAIGPTHRDLRMLALTLGRTWLARGRAEDALELARRSGEALRADAGPDGAGAQAWLELEVRAATALGRFAEASEALTRARPARPSEELSAAAGALFEAWKAAGGGASCEAARAAWTMGP